MKRWMENLASRLVGKIQNFSSNHYGLLFWTTWLLVGALGYYLLYVTHPSDNVPIFKESALEQAYRAGFKSSYSAQDLASKLELSKEIKISLSSFGRIDKVVAVDELGSEFALTDFFSGEVLAEKIIPDLTTNIKYTKKIKYIPNVSHSSSTNKNATFGDAYFLGGAVLTLGFMFMPFVELRRRAREREGASRTSSNQGQSPSDSSSYESAQARGLNRVSIPMVLPDQINGSSDQIIGMEDIKQEVNQVVHYFKNMSQYAEHGINKGFNVMFSGPAGTGKSKLASFLAKELNLPLFYASGSNLETGFVGGGSSSLREVYINACAVGRAVIFLDEAQSLFMKRGRGRNKWEDDTTNTFLSILDGVSTQKDKEIIWVVASNFDQNNLEMDEAMLRRFEMKINFRLPNKEERQAIFDYYLKQKSDEVKESNLNLEYLAEITANVSPATIETICKKASFVAIQEGTKITNDVLYRAFEKTTIGLVNKATTENLDKVREIVATHELGHFIVQYDNAVKKYGEDIDILKKKLPVLKISTECISSIGALGFVLNKQEDVRLQTKSELEQEVCVLYGGVAAEECFYGKDNITTGSSNDIDKATDILDKMVNSLNMGSSAKISMSKLGVSKEKQLELITKKADDLYTKTLDVVDQNKELILALRSVLMEKFVLTLDEMLHEINKLKQASSTQSQIVIN